MRWSETDWGKSSLRQQVDCHADLFLQSIFVTMCTMSRDWGMEIVTISIPSNRFYPIAYLST